MTRLSGAGRVTKSLFSKKIGNLKQAIIKGKKNNKPTNKKKHILMLFTSVAKFRVRLILLFFFLLVGIECEGGKSTQVVPNHIFEHIDENCVEHTSYAIPNGNNFNQNVIEFNSNAYLPPSKSSQNILGCFFFSLW